MSYGTYRYLDLSSQFRNRVKYPYPSDFMAPVALGTNSAANAFQAVDPIAAAFPSEISTTQAGSTTTEIVLNAGASAIQNFYDGDYLQIGTEYRIITAYNATTQTATVNTAFSAAPLIGTQYYIRGDIPVLSSNLVAGSTQNVLNLGSAASSVDGAYNGFFVYFTSGPNIGVAMLILAYQGAIQQAILTKALPNVPGATDAYDILAYTRDNLSPMVYSGTTTFNEPVCYSIELLYLVIPNVAIKNAYGGTFDKYPYLYLRLYSEGNNHAFQSLYSNNPHTQMVLFKIPIGLNLRTETFFTLRDAKMIATTKFRPNDSLRFTLTFPSGEPIIFNTPDNVSPLPPNPFLQISATFAIRRIDGDINRH